MKNTPIKRVLLAAAATVTMLSPAVEAFAQDRGGDREAAREARQQAREARQQQRQERQQQRQQRPQADRPDRPTTLPGREDRGARPVRPDRPASDGDRGDRPVRPERPAYDGPRYGGDRGDRPARPTYEDRDVQTPRRDRDRDGRPNYDRSDRYDRNDRNDRPNYDRNDRRPVSRERAERRRQYERQLRQRFNRDQWRSNWQRRQNRNWWRNHRWFRGYSGIRYGFYFAPGYGYYNVPRSYWNVRYYPGSYLPNFFWRYRVMDPYFYNLPPAPPGTQWIYVNNAILLVDMYDGYIIDVIDDVWYW